MIAMVNNKHDPGKNQANNDIKNNQGQDIPLTNEFFGAKIQEDRNTCRGVLIFFAISACSKLST